MDQLEHYGVKGMKWGVRRAGKAYMSATRKHEAKTKARREKVKNIKAAEKAHAKEVWSKAGKSYMNAARKHEAKTQARTQKRKEALKNAGKAYMDASRKHEAKTQARTQKRKEKVAKVITKTLNKLPSSVSPSKKKEVRDMMDISKD